MNSYDDMEMELRAGISQFKQPSYSPTLLTKREFAKLELCKVMLTEKHDYLGSYEFSRIDVIVDYILKEK